MSCRRDDGGGAHDLIPRTKFSQSLSLDAGRRQLWNRARTPGNLSFAGSAERKEVEGFLVGAMYIVYSPSARTPQMLRYAEWRSGPAAFE